MEAADAVPLKAFNEGGQFASAQDEDAADEVEALLSEVGTTEVDDYSVDLYGFIDFTYSQFLTDYAAGSPFSSFAVGNFNLYLASNLGDNWSSLAEVRFSYLPHGALTVSPPSRADTTTLDYTVLERPVRLGSSIIQRVWLEYSAHPLLNVRAGHWLTPYGIWNVDHGTPVIVGARAPFIVGEELLPNAQTGLQIHGIHHLSQVQLGYHLTLSNGRGPVDTHKDMNHDKALGGRLFGKADTSVGTMTVGVSAYVGTFTNVSTVPSFDSDGNIRIEYNRTEEYDETSLAADLKWDWAGFWFQAEGILNDVTYDDLRPVDSSVGADPPGFEPDQRRFGAYGLTGYRFNWLGTMPFGGIQYYEAGSAADRTTFALFAGLNVRPTPRVVLKAQYSYATDPSKDTPSDLEYHSLDLQTAWSF